MQIPEQAKPVARGVTNARPTQDSHVRPQTCWCMDPNGTGATWFCQSGRVLVDTQYSC